MSYSAYKSILQNNLKTHLEDAAKQAYLTTASGADGDYAAICDESNNNVANSFAAKFAEVLSPTLAQDIYDFCMSVEIMYIPSAGVFSPNTGTGIPEPIQGFACTTSGEIKVE